MTAPEACELVVSLIREVRAARTERDSWRLVAIASMQHNAELTRELEIVDQRQYICRTRTQDERDLFLDHRDLRLVANQGTGQKPGAGHAA